VPANFAAYLRVYEPLTAFDRERQLYWRRYVKDGRAVAPLDGPGKQRTVVLEALGAGWTRLPDLPDEAYVLETDETLLICPWNLRVRVAEAALSARDGVPPVLADAFVPPILAGLAKTIVDDWRSGARVLERGMPRVHEQVATWGVPLRWFVFVDLSEKVFSTREGHRVLRYRTEISKARRRAHRAHSVLRKALGDAPTDATRILLAHRPQAAEEASRYGVDLQLSGHTHGGQFFPFNLLIRRFQPVVRGLHRVGRTALYVSRGTGYWGPPSRLGVGGEITVIELV